MPSDESADCVQLLGLEPAAVCEYQRLKPELAGLVLTLHVYVRRFGAVEAREKESIAVSYTHLDVYKRQSLF